MTRHSAFHTILLAGSLLVLPAAQATTSKADYSAGKTRIGAYYKSDKAACEALKNNAKDVCVEEAKAKQKVALAEVEYAYTGKPADGNKVLVAKAESSYAVAKEKCDDKAGNDKDVCIKEAKAAEVRALADAKTGETRTDGNQDVRDADYKVAAEKCEAQAGDPKAACIAAAKAKFGK
jgi:hypothetical protein